MIGDQQQDQNTHIANQSNCYIACQRGLLTELLGSANGEKEEGDCKNIAQNHHRQIQAVIVAHHDAVESKKHRGVGGNGKGQLAAGTGNHQPLHGFVVADNL